MRNVLFCIALLSLITLSCKKKDTPKPVNLFTGKWNMVLVTGGIAGIHMTPAQFGHTRSYTFYHDSTCAIMYDATLTTTVYGTNVGEPYINKVGTPYLQFRNTGDMYEYKFYHDTLTLYPRGLMDGFREWYVKE